MVTLQKCSQNLDRKWSSSFKCHFYLSILLSRLFCNTVTINKLILFTIDVWSKYWNKLFLFTVKFPILRGSRGNYGLSPLIVRESLCSAVRRRYISWVYYFVSFYLSQLYFLPDVYGPDDVPWLVGRLGEALPAAGPALRHGAPSWRPSVVPLHAAQQLSVQELVLPTLEDEPDQTGVFFHY